MSARYEPNASADGGGVAPGTKVRNRQTGEVFEIARRKDPAEHNPTLPWFPGWWLTDGSGLADRVLADDRKWEVLDG